jgi:hypothetical protein
VIKKSQSSKPLCVGYKIKKNQFILNRFHLFFIFGTPLAISQLLHTIETV